MDMSTGEQALKAQRRHARSTGRLARLSIFFREFCRHPAMIGSIIPSSNRLIARMLSRIDWDRTRLFVEYGPGVGTFTQPILDRLPPDATLVAIDTNPKFIAHLRQNLPDPRLVLINGSATEIGRILSERGLGPADYVVSGLPFSTLPVGVGPAIVQATHAALRPGGAFIAYQYAPKILRLMHPWFARIDRDFEPFNIPPAQIFWAWKD